MDTRSFANCSFLSPKKLIFWAEMLFFTLGYILNPIKLALSVDRIS
jgi:hypothetical protein